MWRDAEMLLDEITETLPEVGRLLAGHRLTSPADWKLTVAQMRVLRALPDRAARSAAELARRLGITCSALIGLADVLVEQGLVERRVGLSDRAVVYLRLSRMGREARDSFRKRRRRRAAAVLGCLPPQQLEQIAESVTLLRQALCRDEEASEPA